MKSPGHGIPPRLDLTMVHTLKALFDTGQVSKAAKLLEVSQPSVSQNLRRLRAFFDDPLFVRSGNRLQPTPRAMGLEPLVGRLVRDVELISERPARFDPSTANREFIVCLTDIAEFMVLPRVIAQFRKEAPGCSLRSVRPRTSDILQQLEQGDVDVVAGTLYGVNESLRQLRLGEFTFVCLTSVKGRWARRPLTMRDYIESQHVTVPRTSDTRDPIMQRLEQLGVRRLIALVAVNHVACASAVDQADLLFTVPEHVGGELASLFGLKVHPVPLNLGTAVSRIIWHERFHHDFGNLWLRKQVVRAFRAVLPQQPLKKR